jgi:hypothetical protein
MTVANFAWIIREIVMLELVWASSTCEEKVGIDRKWLE